MPRNPIISGVNPDPTICRVGDDYYLATSTFEYFPAVPIYHSRDLINWDLLGHALTRPSQLNMRTTDPGGGIWAPTLRYNKGRWYMIVCCVWKYGRRPHLRVKPRGFFVYTDDIKNDATWSDPIPIDMLGIDQDLFFDDDGKVYLSATMWTTISPVKDRFSSFISEIDITTGRSLTRPVLLRQSDLINDCAEGPHIFKRGEWYYLLTAEGGTEYHHRAMIFRGKAPMGPYHPPPPGVNPLVNNSPDDPAVRQTGHADMLEAPDGKWWAVLLATRRQAGNTEQIGRETFLVPVEWTDEGWPVFNKGQPVTLEVLGDGLPESPPRVPWRDDFDKDTLQPGWYHLRTPLREDYSLTHSPGRLALYGNPYTIDMQECPAMLLRRQTSYSSTWSTRLSLQPEEGDRGHEAGVVVYWSKYSYIALLLKRAREGEGMEVVVRWIDEENDEVKETVAPASSKDVTLTIRAQPTSYTCLYQLADAAEPTALATLSSKVIQRDRFFESPYCGAFFGLFAHNTDLVQSLVPAVFEYASLVDHDG